MEYVYVYISRREDVLWEIVVTVYVLNYNTKTNSALIDILKVRKLARFM